MELSPEIAEQMTALQVASTQGSPISIPAAQALHIDCAVLPPIPAPLMQSTLGALEDFMQPFLNVTPKEMDAQVRV